VTAGTGWADLCPATRGTGPCICAPGPPLTHYWHCWRNPGHHACAVALIERQAAENQQLTGQVAALERAARDDKETHADAAE
jgi:hypothetical protein